MQVPFTHPLATHPAGTILGFRTDGRPIFVIAGGNGEGEGGSGTGNPPAPAGGNPSANPPAPPTPANPPTPTPPAPTPPAGGAEPDWKAEARKWEQRAKDNKGAADELEKLKASQMSEQERAVAEAEKRGRTAAAIEHGKELAAARFEAAASKAGVNLGDAADLIDTARFVDKDGKVDTDGIQAAVKKLAKLAPAKGPGRSGGDLGGGSGHQAPTIEQQIAEAQSKGNWREVMRLQNTKLAAAAEAAQQ